MKKVLLFVFALALTACAPKFQSLGLEEFEKTIARNKVVVIDVRTPQEYNASHIEGAINIDWKAGHFAEEVQKQVPNKNQKIAVYCIHARRSKLAGECLDSLGYRCVVELAPGFEAWLKADKPVEK